MKLHVLQRGTVVYTVDIGARSLTIGRAPDNDLILRDPDVSGHHALLYWEAGELWVRDLGSTNGTFHAGQRVSVMRVGPEDELRLGGLLLRLDAGATAAAGLALRKVGAPVAVPVESGFSLPDHPEAALFVDTDGVWLDLGADRRALPIGEPFVLGSDRFVLEEASAVAPTVPKDGLFPYALQVDLSAPLAVLGAPSLEPVEYRSEARVSLLYVLSETPGTWIDNDAIGRGVWGRDWERQGANNLNVLVHRVRKQAEDLGYDRRFIERDRTAMRLAISEAHRD